MKSLVEKVQGNIEKFGLSILSIGPDPDNDIPPFTYSIGLSLKNGSELLCESLPPDLAQYLINEIASQFPKHGIRIDHSCIVRGLIQDNMPIALVESDEEDISETRTIQVSNLVDVDQYKVLQLILPDANGLFPWEEGHDESMGLQNIHRCHSNLASVKAFMDSTPRYIVSPEDDEPTKH